MIFAARDDRGRLVRQVKGAPEGADGRGFLSAEELGIPDEAWQIAATKGNGMLQAELVLMFYQLGRAQGLSVEEITEGFRSWKG